MNGSFGWTWLCWGGCLDRNVCGGVCTINRQLFICLKRRFLGNCGTGSSLPVQSGAAGTHGFPWGLGGLVPAPNAAGALGPGGLCGPGSVRSGGAGLGCLCSAVWMLLRPTEEEAEGRRHLDASKREWKRLNFILFTLIKIKNTFTVRVSLD